MPETTSDLDLFWWPGIESLEDLVVESAEEGFLLSAPAQTLCSDWLEYWSKTPEREALFSQEFQKVLLNHAKQILEQHGESTLTNQQENDSIDSQEVSAGAK